MTISNCHSVNVLLVCMIFMLQNVYSDSRWRSGCYGYTLHGLRSILYMSDVLNVDFLITKLASASIKIKFNVFIVTTLDTKIHFVGIYRILANMPLILELIQFHSCQLIGLTF